MEKRKGTLLIGNFGGRDGLAPQHKPSLHGSVRMPMLPINIFTCVLSGCNYSLSVHDSSQVDDDHLDIIDGEEWYAENQGNSVHLASVIWHNYTLDDSGEEADNDDMSFGYVLEIQTNGVFMFAKIGKTPWPQYHRVIDDEMRHRVEDAFIRASALIGVSVRRGLVIDHGGFP